jgi:hypothetical protein
MSQLILGENVLSYGSMLPVAVEGKNGETVVVNNIAGTTLNYYKDTSSAPAGTIAASASQTFTTPVWIQPQPPGRTYVQITGGKHGRV